MIKYYNVNLNIKNFNITKCMSTYLPKFFWKMNALTQKYIYHLYFKLENFNTYKFGMYHCKTIYLTLNNKYVYIYQFYLIKQKYFF